jgi:hypothetical protein
MEIQEETYLKICSIKKNIKNITRKEDSDNVEYILKKYNEFKIDNDIRNYLYDISPLFAGKKLNIVK